MRWGQLMGNWDLYRDQVLWDYTELLDTVKDPEAYINWIDENITNGQLSDDTRRDIYRAMNRFSPSTESDFMDSRILQGMFLALISPDYCIRR